MEGGGEVPGSHETAAAEGGPSSFASHGKRARCKKVPGGKFDLDLASEEAPPQDTDSPVLRPGRAGRGPNPPAGGGSRQGSWGLPCSHPAPDSICPGPCQACPVTAEGRPVRESGQGQAGSRARAAPMAGSSSHCTRQFMGPGSRVACCAPLVLARWLVTPEPGTGLHSRPREHWSSHAGPLDPRGRCPSPTSCPHRLVLLGALPASGSPWLPVAPPVWILACAAMASGPAAPGHAFRDSRSPRQPRGGPLVALAQGFAALQPPSGVI